MASQDHPPPESGPLKPEGEIFDLAPEPASPRPAPPPTAEELARLRARERAEMEPLASAAELDELDDAIDAESQGGTPADAHDDAEGVKLVVKEPLVRPRIAEAGTIAIAGGVVLLAAMILAWTTVEKDGFARAIATLVNTLTFSLLGIAAAWVVAQIEARPFGSYGACAARMLFAVAAFQCGVRINLGLPAHLGEIAMAGGLYFVTLMILFGWSPRRASRVAGFHFMLSLLVGLTILANSWVSTK
jgi:hypothetical protein